MKWLRDRKLLAGVALALLAIVGGAMFFSAKQTREQHRNIAALVADSSALLARALGGEPTPDQLSRAQANLAALKGLKATHQRAFADAAEHYLVATRAIVERSLDRARFGRQATRSRPVLVAHMNAQARRDPGWIRTATELKKRVETDYYDQDRVLKALVDLLEALPDATKGLAPHVEASALVDEPLRQRALARARADLARSAAELGELRRLAR